ncbi:MAG: 3'-5' DNA helicase [Chrysothrix sp. TS-e1954]|nr:MAG: 3'-5' DNA helicase [Chrysothrix sp. TS-e1954]
MPIDGSEEDAFEPSPVPRKRRRLNRTVLDTSEAEAEASTQVKPLRSKRVETSAAKLPSKGKSSKSDNNPQHTESLPSRPIDTERKARGRPRKQSPDPNLVKVRKHRIIVNEGKHTLQDTFCTQIPPQSSCPWRVRGPIWQKQATPSAPALQLDSVRIPEALSSSQPGLSSTLQAAPGVTGVGRNVDKAKVQTTRQYDTEDDAFDDDAFEPLAQARTAGIESSLAGSETPDEPAHNDSPRETSSEEESDEMCRRESSASSQTSRDRLASRQGTLRPPLPNIEAEPGGLYASMNLPEIEPHEVAAPSPVVDALVALPKQEIPSDGHERPKTWDPFGVVGPNDKGRYDLTKELEDLPSDAFASSTPSSTRSPQRLLVGASFIPSEASSNTGTRLVGPQQGLRQMTLFGDTAQHISAASQANKVHSWPVSNRNEPPTHHRLDEEALKTWVYPTNLGTIRDYQYNIVMRGLYHNLLVALPTGLGKTFIAATIMLNWYRWTKDAQIVFVAPTKPLVSQQVEACFGVAGIPRSQTSMLTGSVSPGLRAEEWASKRVFFMTPQTIVNDLKTGSCDPKRIVLLVVDEAHRATGAYAYVEVVNLIRRFNPSFRVLGLTATPGSSVETVQQVIDGLDISRVEIRTEFSLDIRQYVHSRDTETVSFEPSDEMGFISTMFSDAVRPVLQQLVQHNGYWSKDPMGITVFGLRQQQQKWNASEPGRKVHVGIKVKVNKIFGVLIRLASSVDLLKFHGIRPFYKGMDKFRKTCEESQASTKYEREILDSVHFNNMMGTLDLWHKRNGFVGHPKLDYLQDVILRHFSEANERRELAPDRPTSRIMVFVQYRGSAEVVTEILQAHSPLVKPHLFVGQAASKDSEGMDQAKQLEVINKFKDGTYNVLVATSIGEEGLDIGEIDLIVCYDSSASPIRMLQRMGRTGRKRAGNIVVLLMKGKEENNFAQSKDNYEKMQQKISAGTEFTFHDDRSTRIVPKTLQPVVDKRMVEIPKENSQAALPEPKKKGGRAPKRPQKKFHMPDGVRTGFVSASRLDDDDEDEENGSRSSKPRKPKRRPAPNVGPQLELMPSLDDVVLTVAQEKELRRQYQNVSDMSETAVLEPRLHMYPSHQRSLTGTRHLKHGSRTKIVVKVLNAIHNTDLNTVKRFRRVAENLDIEALCQGVKPLTSEEDSRLPLRTSKTTTKTAQPKRSKTKKAATKSARAKTVSRESDHMEAPPGSAPLTSPRMRLLSQGLSLGSADTDGEDDQELPDSDLADFIVEGENEADEDDDTDDSHDDDDLVNSTHSPPPAANGTNNKKPMNIFTSQETTGFCASSGEGLPALTELFAGNERRPEDNQMNGKNACPAVRAPNKRLRRVVEDSSSDF